MNRSLVSTWKPSKPCVSSLRGVVLLSTIALANCSSGDGTGSNGGPDGSGSNGQSGLEGTIFVSSTSDSVRTGEIWAIDPTTRVAELYVRPTTDSDLLYETPKFLPPISLGNGEFLLSSNACLDLGVLVDNFCIDRIDATGAVQRVVGRGNRYLTSRASMSPDGSMVVYVEQLNRDSGPFLMRMVNSSDRSVIDESSFDKGLDEAYFSDSMAWTSDNRLIYGYSEPGLGSFIITTMPGSLESDARHPATRIIDSQGVARVENISLSNNGSLLAYDVLGGNRPASARVFVRNLETRVTTPLQTSEAHDVLAPVWSPDDRYLLVNHTEVGLGLSVSTPIFGLVPLPYQMLVEWTGQPVDIDVFSDDRTIDEGGMLFNVDPGSSSPAAGPQSRWLFDYRKSWQ